MIKYNKITTVEEIDIHRCPFCDAVCDVERNKIRPKITGMASSMHWHGTPQIYDEFGCPNNNIKWHKTLMEYHEELNETKSPRLRELILKDISDLLKLNLEKQMEEYFIKKFPCWLVITEYKIDIYETKEEAYSAFAGFSEAGRIVKLNSENKCE